MQVTTRMLDPERYESTSQSGLKVTVDMRSNELRAHQNPTELLLSAVTACSAVDVVTILGKRKKTIHAMDIITTGKRRAEHPRAFTDIHIEYTIHSGDVTEDEALKAAKLAIERYCSVAASLKSKITWSAKIIAPKKTITA